jgi:glycosyltransferase involved in cell wall biosynthesis
MRLLLVGNYPPDGQESMQRFAGLLESELRERGVEVRLLRPKPWLIRLVGAETNPHQGLAKWWGYLDKFVLFPLVLWRAARGYDLIHICDHSNSMYGRWTAGKPWMVTCNDLLAVRSALGEFPQNSTGRLGRLLQGWILHWLNRAPTIACISEATRQDVLRLTDQPADYVNVIHMGLNHPYRRRPEAEWRSTMTAIMARRSLKESTRFVFHVGGNQWYKNREGVMALFANLARDNADLYLLIAGKGATEKQTRRVLELGLGQRVHFLGPVSNNEMEALYHGAEFLLFPSLAEGFGWPVIEAQACGCRVATSQRTSLPEVGGESTLYLDLDNEAECIERLLALLMESAEQRESRVQGGFQNIERFRPELMVEKYLKIYGGVKG